MNDLGGIALPQPDEITKREKEDAMGAYLMMFAAWGIGLPLPILNLIAALIYYGVNTKKSRFVAFHALQSLLSQIPVTLANLAVIAWLIRNLVYANQEAPELYRASDIGFGQAFWWYLGVTIALNLSYIVISLVALSRAHKGNFFYMPIFGHWAFDVWWGPDRRPLNPEGQRDNRPPGRH